MLGMSANSLSYNDQGGAETGVEVGQETTPTTSFGLFTSDFKK